MGLYTDLYMSVNQKNRHTECARADGMHCGHHADVGCWDASLHTYVRRSARAMFFLESNKARGAGAA